MTKVRITARHSNQSPFIAPFSLPKNSPRLKTYRARFAAKWPISNSSPAIVGAVKTTNPTKVSTKTFFRPATQGVSLVPPIRAKYAANKKYAQDFNSGSRAPARRRTSGSIDNISIATTNGWQTFRFLRKTPSAVQSPNAPRLRQPAGQKQAISSRRKSIQEIRVHPCQSVARRRHSLFHFPFSSPPFSGALKLKF
jgi:hypothetical protein